VIKEVLVNFNKTGQFERAYLGVKYKMVDKQTAVMNDLPQGAFVSEVVKDSPAEKGGILAEDVIVKFGGENVNEVKGGLGELVGKHKVGETLQVELWRGKESKTISVTLETLK
jgi:serine protease Do